jgi:modulator of FtsH protease HflK
MPWQNQGGGGGPWGGGGGGGPWGGGGSRSGGGGPQPPNLEDVIRQGQDRLKRLFPSGFGGGRGILIIGLIVVALWAVSGFYRVLPDEQGVVTRFGALERVTQPGLHYHLPYPVEAVQTPKVTRVNRVEVGFRAAPQATGTLGRGDIARQVPEEALILTGDENIVDINFVVFWVIKNAGEYLFNIRAQEATVKAAAESVVREIVGQTPIATVLAEGRGLIETSAREAIQESLDSYGAGIQVTQVQLLKADPPSQVIDAFRDVQRARADQERLRNEAEAYRNDIIPRARGEAERLIQEAEAYKQQTVTQSQGEAQRFTDVYAAYEQARDVTLTRIYIETMQEVLTRSNKIIIDQDNAGGQGVIPYLPLPEVQKRLQQSGAQSQQPQTTGGTGQMLRGIQR